MSVEADPGVARSAKRVSVLATFARKPEVAAAPIEPSPLLAPEQREEGHAPAAGSELISGGRGRGRPRGSDAVRRILAAARENAPPRARAEIARDAAIAGHRSESLGNRYVGSGAPPIARNRSESLEIVVMAASSPGIARKSLGLARNR